MRLISTWKQIWPGIHPSRYFDLAAIRHDDLIWSTLNTVHASQTGVSFVIANFGSLFGTTTGAILRKWCIGQGWVLAWALDDASDPFHGGNARSFEAVTRVLDPGVLLSTSVNLSATTAAAFNETFNATWDAAAKLIPTHVDCHGLSAQACKAKENAGCEWQGLPGKGGKCVMGGAPSLSTAAASTLWAVLRSARDANSGKNARADFGGLAVEPLGGRSCAKPGNCIGVSASSGDCVCYRP